MTSHRVSTAIIVVAAICFGILLLATVGHMLFVIFGGVLFAILLSNSADLIAEQSGVARSWSLATLLLLLLLTLGAGTYFMATGVVEQARQFLADLPKYSEAVADFVKRQPGGEALVTEFSGVGSETIGAAASMSGMKLLYGVIDLVVIVFIGIYLAIQPDVYTSGVAALFPKNKRSRAREVLGQAGTTLFWWLLGRLASMTIVGILVGVGLWILGVPLALALGVWSGLVSFIPNVGPILSTVATGVVALDAGGSSLLLYTVLLHIGVQIVESYVITPLIQKMAIAMPPALTLSAQAVIGTLFGVIGLAFATPLVALSTLLLRQLYIGDYLGDESAKRGIAAGEPQ